MVWSNIIPTKTTPKPAGWSNILPSPKPTSSYTPPVSQPVVQQQQAPLSAALNYNYNPTALPAYNPQAYNVNLPTIDWGFTPTDVQRGNWQTQATATAAQEIDPQLQALQAALDQYMTKGQNIRNELNPRYTNQSLAIANIIENTVKQEAIDSAVRRGAETSGWLPDALMEAGRFETEQRGNIETQRNRELSELSALEASLTQTTGAQSTMLEGLRGQRITSELANLENIAWGRSQQEKESRWTSALGGEQLRASAFGQNAVNQLAGYQTQASVAMSDADRALAASIAQSNQANTLWNQQYTTSQDAYQRSLAAANTAQGGVAKEPMGYVQGVPYYDIAGLQRLYQTFGLGGYTNTPAGGTEEPLTGLELEVDQALHPEKYR